MIYNWQQSDWTHFTYRSDEIAIDLQKVLVALGTATGLFQSLSKELQEQSLLDLMIAEAIKTSAIEGEFVSREDVLSSIRNHLGLNRIPERIKDIRAKGIAELMVAVRQQFNEPLSKDMLCNWHTMLMQGYQYIRAGQWRSSDQPMQIVSGAIGREIIHYEAPPSSKVPQEMTQFFHWYHHKSQQMAAPVKSAIAHLYFESIHPFEDGNGRIGRAISEKVLSEGLGRPIFLSLSKVIEADRNSYYEALKTAQRSNEITAWIQYFLQVILQSQEQTTTQIQFSLEKTQFFDHFRPQLNERQEKALQKMLVSSWDGFKGGMSAKKYMSITKTSKSTATRDLAQLVQIGALKVTGAGRNTRYVVNHLKRLPHR